MLLIANCFSHSKSEKKTRLALRLILRYIVLSGTARNKRVMDAGGTSMRTGASKPSTFTNPVGKIEGGEESYRLCAKIQSEKRGGEYLQAVVLHMPQEILPKLCCRLLQLPRRFLTLQFVSPPPCSQRLAMGFDFSQADLVVVLPPIRPSPKVAAAILPLIRVDQRPPGLDRGLIPMACEKH